LTHYNNVLLVHNALLSGGHYSGQIYFAQLGHYYIAVTLKNTILFVAKYKQDDKIKDHECGKSAKT